MKRVGGYRYSFLMANISFNIVCKELKIAQIVQVNQLFPPLNLVRIYGHHRASRSCKLCAKL